MDTVTKLKNWLDRPENSKTKLAFLLGYKSSETIRLWIEHKQIPAFQEKRVLEIITKKEKN